MLPQEPEFGGLDKHGSRRSLPRQPSMRGFAAMSLPTGRNRFYDIQLPIALLLVTSTQVPIVFLDNCCVDVFSRARHVDSERVVLE